jgi:hypothetical protein
MKFAQHPPLDDSFLTTRLWDQHLPKWRANVAAPPDPTARKAVMERVRQTWEKAKQGSTRATLSSKEPDYYVIENRVPPRKGKWRILPPEVTGRA